ESDKFDEFDESYGLDEYDNRNEFNEFNESNEKSRIISEFIAADMGIQKLSVILKEHPDIVYASNLINIHDIVQQYRVCNQHNESDLGDQCSASIISFEIPVVNDRSKRQKLDQESHNT
ncbi:5379_t:CDS:2, partial [Gigaspora margarita]